MPTLGEFTVALARPLPVIVLADISGSMAQNQKIEALNQAIAEMIASFAELDEARAEVHVAVIAFGGAEARIHVPLIPAHSLDWSPLAASGKTPMGQAIELATKLLEDRDQLPSRAYCPTLVLVSDGIPTDEWKEPLRLLKESARGSKAHRVAMAIGADAQERVLETFIDANGDDSFVFRAHDARDIRKFFRWVTMSTQQQTRSANPNQPQGWTTASTIYDIEI